MKRIELMFQHGNGFSRVFMRGVGKRWKFWQEFHLDPDESYKSVERWVVRKSLEKGFKVTGVHSDMIYNKLDYCTYS